MQSRRRRLPILGVAWLALLPLGCEGDTTEREPIVTEDGGVDAPGTAPDAAAAAAPVISSVSWVHVPGCAAGVPSNVTFTVSVTDPDTAAIALTFSGSVSGCSNLGSTGSTATLSTNPSTISCPHLAPYPGTITVGDPEGNSDSQSFTIGVCVSGSAP